MYIWQREDWPQFRWNKDYVNVRLSSVRYAQGRLAGKLGAMGFHISSNAMLNAMADDVVASSEIEGVVLNREEVRSSVARHLGLETEGLPVASHYIEGIVEVMMDAVRNAAEPLTAERLFGWHAALFPTGRSGAWKIVVADWRQSTEAMQVVSGPMGKEKVHFQAPDSKDVPHLMDDFLRWVNDDQQLDLVIKAAIAHLWFVTIHPFEDGNGRLTRTITDMLMTRADQMPHRFYSVSAEILQRRNQYYDVLESTQNGNMDITDWLMWFLDTVERAIDFADGKVSAIIDKTRFWDANEQMEMNDRQRKLVNRLLDGFEGKLTTGKWAKIAKCSPDTALRDIQDLIQKGVLRKNDAGGRSTSYELIIKDVANDRDRI